MKYLLSLLLAAVFSSEAFSQSEVKIGNQVWMSKNLDVSTFRNGDPIPQAKTNEEWEKAGENKQPAWCYYENDPANGAKYGKLYNWYAVNDSRGLAPAGFHVPSDAEWTILTDFLGGSDIAGKKMKSTNGWSNGRNGDNSSGFNGLPGGYCLYYGYFYNITDYGLFWSSSEYGTKSALYRVLYDDFTRGVRYNDNKIDGLSVRCVKD